MIALVDYKLGNLNNLKNAFDKIGVKNNIVSDWRQLETATKIVIPGVGAFKAAMNRFEAGNFSKVIKARSEQGCLILGICVGMQIFLQQGIEDGAAAGLGLIKGVSKRLYAAPKIPHVGWNKVQKTTPHPLFQGVKDNDWFYFVHSFYADVDEKNTIAKTDYYQQFCSAIGNKNIWGVQFHPEKSQDSGLQLLKNFSEAPVNVS